jgi:hypothetical protein
MRHGVGTLLKKKKMVYKGEWKFNLYDGQGTLAIDDKLTYFGDFKAGKKSGKGLLTSIEGTYSFSGNFEDDLKVGVGKNIMI